MERIQILLVDMPRIVEEMIEQAVVAQPDMHVVGAVRDPDALVRAARETQPDFVIFGLPPEAEGGFPDGCTELLEEQPRTKALGVAVEASNAYLYELRPERTPLGEVGPEEIVTAIRGAAAAGWVR